MAKTAKLYFVFRNCTFIALLIMYYFESPEEKENEWSPYEFVLAKGITGILFNISFILSRKAPKYNATILWWNLMFIIFVI